MNIAKHLRITCWKVEELQALSSRTLVQKQYKMLNKMLHRNKQAKGNWNMESKKSSSWPTYNNKIMVAFKK